MSPSIVYGAFTGATRSVLTGQDLKLVCLGMEAELGDYGRDLMIEMQPILAKRLQGRNPAVWALDEVRTEMLTLLDQYADLAKDLLIMPTESWSKPLTRGEFKTSKKSFRRTSPEVSVSVYIEAKDSVKGSPPSTAQKYAWTNWGTGERHQKAGPGKSLVFTKGYSASTSPGSLRSTAHSRPAIIPDFSTSGGNVKKKFNEAVSAAQCRMGETQNSVAPRHFDETAAAFLQPMLESDIAKAMARALRKMKDVGNASYKGLGRYYKVRTDWGPEGRFTLGFNKWNPASRRAALEYKSTLKAQLRFR